jgi:hypothetical protein
LSDVCISTELDDGRGLNVSDSDCRGPFDVERRSNISLSIDGSRRSKKEYKSRVRVGVHSGKKTESGIEAK